jgi:hypothetical protein
MTGTPCSHDNDHGHDELGGIPVVLTAPLGYPGAWWDTVEGRPVIVVDDAVTEADRVRFVAAAVRDIRSVYARRLSHGDTEAVYAT